MIVPTIGFRLLYCLLILDHRRRHIASFGITSNPTSEWVARQITEAFPWDEAPEYLIKDRDRASGLAVQQRLDAMDMVVLGEDHLRRVMRAYVHYYNNARTHLSLDKDAPNGRTTQSCGAINSIPHLGGLHHQYSRI